MDEKVVKAKLNKAMEMLKKGNTEDLARKIRNVDMNELMEKMNEYDRAKIEELNIDINEVKRQITEADLARLSALIGERGPEVVQKIKSILNG
ncbi:MAG TPA: membrane trafficking protein [Clostridiaceae bacterium]|nr:membrane trafficking protein [Clostridiaceae bacterium]